MTTKNYKGALITFELGDLKFDMIADAEVKWLDKKKAVVTGVTGQAASYLVELLLEKGYEVWGIYRRTTSPHFENLQNIIENKNLHLVCGDITDSAFIFSCLSSVKPNEIYNLAAQSFVKASFDQPIHTFDVDTTGVLNILEWVRQHSKETKFYQASTSEMFGSATSWYWGGSRFDDIDNRFKECKTLNELKPFQDEKTRFQPNSPYAIAKLAAHHLCRLYREAYGLYVVSNITFNHESPRRGKEFVTRKITDYVGRLVGFRKRTGRESKEFDKDIAYEFPKLQLGNIYSSRDWSHAKDMMSAAFLVMQQDVSDDYVVCSETTHTVEEFLEIAFNYVGLKWKDFVEIDKAHFRPSEVDYLCGSSAKLRNKTGWKPSITFHQLVKEMVDCDIERNRNGSKN